MTRWRNEFFGRLFVLICFILGFDPQWLGRFSGTNPLFADDFDTELIQDEFSFPKENEADTDRLTLPASRDRNEVPLPPPVDDGRAIDTDVPSVETLLNRIEQLEKSEKKRSEAEQKKKADADKKLPIGDKENRKWNVKLGGHVQLEYINWADASPSIVGDYDYFEFRRLRLVADGTGYDVYDFRLQMTLEPEAVGESPAGTVTTPEIKDAYFSINEIPLLGRARIGNFFVPFGLEQVTNDTNNMFLERSIPTQGIFTPDREVGVAFYNHTEDKNATISYGAFFDSISEALKERIDSNQGYRLSGRATWLPYYDEESNGRYLWHTGVGVLYTADNDGRVRVRARPEIHEGPRLVDTGTMPVDSFTTGNLETALVWGPVTIQSEAYISHLNMIGGGDTQLSGAYVHVSYFLTGENRNYERFGQHGAQFGRNSPKQTVYFTKEDWGLGAWELKSRLSHLNFDQVNRGELTDFTLGCNWYWSDRVRIMFDWIHPVTTREAVFGSTKSDILGIRFDFNW